MRKHEEAYYQLWVELNTHHITPDGKRVMQQSPHNHLLEVLKELVYDKSESEPPHPVKTLQELGFKEDEVKKYSDGELVKHYTIFQKEIKISVGASTVIETQKIIFDDTGIYTTQCYVGNTFTSLEINKELHNAIVLEARKWL